MTMSISQILADIFCAPPTSPRQTPPKVTRNPNESWNDFLNRKDNAEREFQRQQEATTELARQQMIQNRKPIEWYVRNFAQGAIKTLTADNTTSSSRYRLKPSSPELAEVKACYPNLDHRPLMCAIMAIGNDMLTGCNYRLYIEDANYNGYHETVIGLKRLTS